MPRIDKYTRLARVSDIPHALNMRDDTIYLISEPKDYHKLAYRNAKRLLVFLCPCGCKEVPSLVSIEPDAPPYWVARIDDNELVTISPSIHRNWEGSCGSHYFIENGKVRWC